LQHSIIMSIASEAHRISGGRCSLTSLANVAVLVRHGGGQGGGCEGACGSTAGATAGAGRAWFGGRCASCRQSPPSCCGASAHPLAAPRRHPCWCGGRQWRLCDGLLLLLLLATACCTRHAAPDPLAAACLLLLQYVKLRACRPTLLLLRDGTADWLASRARTAGTGLEACCNTDQRVAALDQRTQLL
jgi:hypothetical protein